MSSKLIITDKALDCLENISYYIAKETGQKEIAEKFVADIVSKCSRLNNFPEIGALPKEKNLRKNGYRFLVHKSYLIFYIYDKSSDTVSVIAVFNAKCDYNLVMEKYL